VRNCIPHLSVYQAQARGERTTGQKLIAENSLGTPTRIPMITARPLAVLPNPERTETTESSFSRGCSR